MNQHNNHGTSLPHHRLLAYQKSLELLAAVRSAQIRDAKFRDEALRAAKGTCLNSRGDKARAYAIARGECVEAVAATEIAGQAGDAVEDAVADVVAIGNELYLMLGGLIR